jgi:hypothetical protein
MTVPAMTMNKRNGVWLAVIPALVISGILFVYMLTAVHTKTFSRDYIQQQVNSKLPKLVASNRFKVTSANVEFVDHAVKLLIDVEGAKTGNTHATVSAIGRPRYNKKTAEFFFEPEDVTVEQIDWKGQKPSEAVGRVLGNTAANVTDRFESWLKDHAGSIAISTLEGMPVFKIKDEMKWSWVIKSSLQSVEIKNGELVVTFTLWNLTVSVAFFFVLALVCMGIIVAMIANPDLFLAFSLLSLFEG